MSVIAESNVPAWLVADAFVGLLKIEIPNFVKIKSFNASSALKPGENYGTNMLRLSVEVEVNDSDEATKQLSYMIKVPHDNPMAQQMLQLVNVFTIEKLALNAILPELEQLYRDVGVDITFGPRAYVLPENEAGNYVLMEDLAISGFRNVERKGGLDIVHMKRVIKLLAKYHAASVVRVATKGEYSDLSGAMNSEAMQMIFNGMLSSFKDTFLKNMKSYKNGEKYERAVNTFFDKLSSLIGIFYGYDPADFNVLLHGDCWCNNVMFKYTEENEIDDIIFVDFQMPRWGSPLLDLYYLIISSAQLDIKISKFDYFIRVYHDNLIEQLKILKYQKPLPTLRELSEQSLKYGEYGFMTAITTMAGVLVEATDKASADNFMSESADGVTFRNMLYANPAYGEHISELLPWFYNRGILVDE